MVHHNLETIREYYDWLLLLNVRKVAYGPVENILTDENLKITYSGKTGQLITQ